MNEHENFSQVLKLARGDLLDKFSHKRYKALRLERDKYITRTYPMKTGNIMPKTQFRTFSPLSAILTLTRIPHPPSMYFLPISQSLILQYISGKILERNTAGLDLMPSMVLEDERPCVLASRIYPR
jgi:hypothetical protein